MTAIPMSVITAAPVPTAIPIALQAAKQLAIPMTVMIVARVQTTIQGAVLIPI